MTIPNPCRLRGNAGQTMIVNTVHGQTRPKTENFGNPFLLTVTLSLHLLSYGTLLRQQHTIQSDLCWQSLSYPGTYVTCFVVV